MTRKDFNEIRGIMVEMKSNGKIKVFVATPIAMEWDLEGVTVEQPCTQAPISSYVVVTQVQPVR